MSSQEEAVAMVMSITGLAPEQAKSYLDAAHGDVNLAVASFFEGPQQPPAPVRAAQPVQQPPAQPAPPAASKKQPAAKSRIATFSSLQHDGNDDDDEDPSKKRQEFYAGGEKSGIAVQGPNRSDIFAGARKAGAIEEPEGATSQKPSQQKQAFVGQGYKLSDGKSPSQVVGHTVTPQPTQQALEEEKEIKIIFWKNGFSVDDGETISHLRKLDDPANASFLQSVKNGEIPHELRSKGTAQVNVALVDRHDEDFVAPKRQIKSFAGSGHKLGNVVPGNVVSSSQTKTPSSTTATTTTTTIATSTTAMTSLPSFDENQAHTKLQIRLFDGTRLVGKFNNSHTIADIRQFIDQSRASQRPYVLMTTFPNKELKDESLTLEQAALLGAAIVQKNI